MIENQPAHLESQKGHVLATALLTRVRLVTRSASQSRKWQLIDMN